MHLFPFPWTQFLLASLTWLLLRPVAWYGHHTETGGPRRLPALREMGDIDVPAACLQTQLGDILAYPIGHSRYGGAVAGFRWSPNGGFVVKSCASVTEWNNVNQMHVLKGHFPFSTMRLTDYVKFGSS
jgi:hypothetical protein